MEVIAKQHATDMDMVELHVRQWLMGVVHIDHFDGEPYRQALEDGVPVELEMGEADK